MKRAFVIACVVVSSLGAACRAAPPLIAPGRRDTFDVLITGGRVVDGTGAPWNHADIGIVGDRIAAIGKLADQSATTTIDASDLVVAPGFIDMLGQSEFNVLVDAGPRARSRRASPPRSPAKARRSRR